MIVCVSVYYALSDFVLGEGGADYVGMFAVSGGFGLNSLLESADREHDSYRSIMLKALADRFAEAAAERLHEQIRQEYWPFQRTESKASIHELIRYGRLLFTA